VSVVSADVADPAVVRRLVAGIDPAHPLTAVIHAAGALDDAVLTAQAPDRLARVWGPKAAAVANLHAATADLPLSVFAVFSSAAATFGSPGQANYAAANAYCDALMTSRRAVGQPGIAVSWGLWAATSELTRHLGDAEQARMSRAGLLPLSTGQALALFDAACQQPNPHVVAVNLDLAALAAGSAGVVPPLLKALAVPRPGGPAVSASAPDLAARLAGLDPAVGQQLMVTLIQEHAASVLGHANADTIPPGTPFRDLGFDSLTAVELRNRIAAATGLRLPASLVFTYPTCAALAAYLRGELSQDGAEPPDQFGRELDELEAAMAGIEPGGEAEGRLVRRLERMLWRLKDRGGEVSHTVSGLTVETATDTEMFDLIDRELPS
jgi:polyketide synthase 12